MYLLASLTSPEFQALQKDCDLSSLSRRELNSKIKDIRALQQVKESQGFSGSVGELKKGVEELTEDFNSNTDDDLPVPNSGTPPEFMEWYRMVLNLESLILNMSNYFDIHSSVLSDMVVPVRFERLNHAVNIDKRTCEEELYGYD